MIRSSLTALAFCLIGQAAFAHAQLRTASPAVDSTVTLGPTDVTITFSEAVEPRFSTIEVTGPSGQRIDQGDAHLVGGDGKRLGVALASPSAGTYTVTWHVTSVDTHKTEGAYRFTVAEADASAISLEHVWARASAGNATVAAAYMTLTDGGRADRLIGVSTPVAADAQLHETIDDHGVMKMRTVAGVALEPGKAVTFKPGGYHVMLIGLKAPLKAGDTFPLTLTFEKARPMTVTVKVEAAGAPGMGGQGSMPAMGGTHMEHKP